MGFLDKLFGSGEKPPRGGPPQQPPATQPPSEQYLFTLVDEIQSKEGTHGYAALTPAEQVFFCVWTLEAEVNNGGFSQFYYNSSGDIAVDVPGALRAIGADQTASIVDRANALFGPDGPSADSDARQERLEDLEESAEDDFEALDQAFLEYRDNLSELLANYMKATGEGV
jgi:hypothetical protein